jgi:hypothetical protein
MVKEVLENMLHYSHVSMVCSELILFDELLIPGQAVL